VPDGLAQWVRRRCLLGGAVGVARGGADGLVGGVIWGGDGFSCDRPNCWRPLPPDLFDCLGATFGPMRQRVSVRRGNCFPAHCCL